MKHLFVLSALAGVLVAGCGQQDPAEPTIFANDGPAVQCVARGERASASCDGAAPVAVVPPVVIVPAAEPVAE